MKISVVKTFTPKNAGTENSEILKMKTSTKELIKAGFIRGRIIFRMTLRNFVITKPVSSSWALILDKALPMMSIDNGVKIVVSTRITPMYEDTKLVLLKKK